MAINDNQRLRVCNIGNYKKILAGRILPCLNKFLPSVQNHDHNVYKHFPDLRWNNIGIQGGNLLLDLLQVGKVCLVSGCMKVTQFTIVSLVSVCMAVTQFIIVSLVSGCMTVTQSVTWMWLNKLICFPSNLICCSNLSVYVLSCPCSSTVWSQNCVPVWCAVKMCSSTVCSQNWDAVQ